jgi:hypothetical protein
MDASTQEMREKELDPKVEHLLRLILEAQQAKRTGAS